MRVLLAGLVAGFLMLGTAAAQTAIDKSAAMQQRRMVVLQELIDRGIVQRFEVPNRLPQVWVLPAFSDLDFDQKQTILSIVYAYHFDSVSVEQAVRVYDSRTGEAIGQFTAIGLDLF